jgi:hypothetical protein
MVPPHNSAASLCFIHSNASSTRYPIQSSSSFDHGSQSSGGFGGHGILSFRIRFPVRKIRVLLLTMFVKTGFLWSFLLKEFLITFEYQASREFSTVVEK